MNQNYYFILNTKALNLFKQAGDRKSPRESPRFSTYRHSRDARGGTFCGEGGDLRSEYVFSVTIKCLCAFVVTNHTKLLLIMAPGTNFGTHDTRNPDIFFYL